MTGVSVSDEAITTFNHFKLHRKPSYGYVIFRLNEEKNSSDCRTHWK